MKINHIFKLKFKIIKISIILILLIIELLISNYLLKINDKLIKICLYTIGKKENKYVKEYVEHY